MECPISKVPDERFGTVNSYREDVLEEVFDPIEEPHETSGTWQERSGNNES
jgi:hypothetical protein